jgi:hypothetical protein
VKIDPALEHLAVPIGDLVPHPENQRLSDVEAIAASLERFGQVRPIVVQASSGYVVAGNHLLATARELGAERVAAVRVDLDDEDALAYLLADNRIADLGGYDQRGLAGLLERMMRAGQLQGTGYSPDDVDDLRAAIDAVDEVEGGQDGDWFEPPEDTAKRRIPPEEFEPMREVQFFLSPAGHAEFADDVRSLKRAWGVETARDVCVEAVRRAAAAAAAERKDEEDAEEGRELVELDALRDVDGEADPTAVEPEGIR